MAVGLARITYIFPIVWMMGGGENSRGNVLRLLDNLVHVVVAGGRHAGWRKLSQLFNRSHMNHRSSPEQLTERNGRLRAKWLDQQHRGSIQEAAEEN